MRVYRKQSWGLLLSRLFGRAALLDQTPKVRTITRPAKPRRVPPEWHCEVPIEANGYRGTASFKRRAWTKGEFRALVKRDLKLDRLPGGTSVTKVGEVS